VLPAGHASGFVQFSSVPLDPAWLWQNLDARFARMLLGCMPIERMFKFLPWAKGWDSRKKTADELNAIGMPPLQVGATMGTDTARTALGRGGVRPWLQGSPDTQYP